MKLLLLLCASVFALSDVHATVLIYKGTTNTKAKPNQLVPNRVTTYLLYEPDTNRTLLVRAYRKNGMSVVDDEFAIPVRRTVANVSNGKQATILHLSVADDTSAQTFSDSIAYLRGTNDTITIDSSGTVQQHPRTLEGIRYTAATFSGVGRFSEERFLFSLMKTRTKTANDGSQDIFEARDALLGELNKN
jgi:hypothetical protein